VRFYVSIPWQNDDDFVARMYQRLRQRADNISEPAGFRVRQAFRGYKEYFHPRWIGFRRRTVLNRICGVKPNPAQQLAQVCGIQGPGNRMIHFALAVL
jgi:hypothetical protein